MKKEIKKVIIIDDSSFVPEKGANGGCYRYKYTYSRINKNSFEVEYSTSSEFDFCGILGEYQECWRCFYYKNGECTATPQTMTTSEVAEVVRSYYKAKKKGEDITIKFIR